MNSIFKMIHGIMMKPAKYFAESRILKIIKYLY